MSEAEFRRGYRVKLGHYAEGHFTEITGYIVSNSQQAAQAWIDGFYRLIDDIGDFKINFGYAIENDRSSQELRQVVYHSHRVIYTI